MSRPEIDEWIIYTRISDDREGAGLGVERQLKDCRTHHERVQLGGKIIAELVDNDLTANDKSKRYKTRPGYKKLCEMLAERPGRIGIITWHNDRLHRSPRELEDFIDLMEKTGGTVQTVKAGEVDLSTPSGRMIARQMCVFARYETEHKAERNKAKVIELAAAGKVHGGGPRPFGYDRIYDGPGDRRRILRHDVNPAEADAIRECTRRVLAGHSLNSVRQWLNTQGITATTGRPWSMQALRRMLMAARIAGLREHLGVTVGPATWDAIITAEEHRQLRVVLSARTKPAGNNARKYYLSGFVWCSACQDKGIRMAAAIGHGKVKLRCPPERGGCNGRTIDMAGLAAFIDGFVQHAVSDPKVLSRIAAREADTGPLAQTLTAQVAGYEARLEAISGSLRHTDVASIPGVIDAMADFQTKIAEGRARIAELTATKEDTLDVHDVVARWESAPLDEKRGVLAAVVDRIVIYPAVRGRSAFDADRIVVLPAGQSVPRPVADEA